MLDLHWISVCIIVKNEERNIGKCLKALNPYGFEIVVIDTGSTDRTLEIVKKYTDKIYDFKWCNDFAKARNYSIHKASNTMIMVMDADEILEAFEIEGFSKMLVASKEKVGRIQRINHMESNGEKQISREWINRIFSKELYEYSGRIHEQIVAKDSSLYSTYCTEIKIQHLGYTVDEIGSKQKVKRNLTLLFEMLEESPEDPYIIYQIGKAYYMALDYDKSSEYLGKTLGFDLNPQLEYVIDAVEMYGYSLLNSGKSDEALGLEGVFDTFGETSDFRFLMGLIYMNNEMYQEAIDMFLDACKVNSVKTRVEGTNSYLALYNMGVIYECLGYSQKALEYYNKCGGYFKAQERLKTVKNNLDIVR